MASTSLPAGVIAAIKVFHGGFRAAISLSGAFTITSKVLVWMAASNSTPFCRSHQEALLTATPSIEKWRYLALSGIEMC